MAWRSFHRPTDIFSAHFVFTCAHSRRISGSATHLGIAPDQTCLTLEFFRDEILNKNLQLVSMSILLILLSCGPGCQVNLTVDFVWWNILFGTYQIDRNLAGQKYCAQVEPAIFQVSLCSVNPFLRGLRGSERM